MSELIDLQIRFFLASVVWGIILLVIYDVLRILRRLVTHSVFVVFLEDVVFWIVSGVLIFKMMYEQNNGVIRGFSILAMGLGMVLYHSLVSNVVVEKISKCIRFLLEPFRIAIGAVVDFFKLIRKKVKKVLKVLVKRLKKPLKTVKIALTKK